MTTRMPDTTELALGHALAATGYERTTRIANHAVLEHHHQLDTEHHVTFEYAPETLPDQTRLTVRHGAKQVTWDGIDDVQDAVVLLARLGVIGTCRTCDGDVPVPAGEVECDTHAQMTLDLPTQAVATIRHTAHQAA